MRNAFNTAMLAITVLVSACGEPGEGARHSAPEPVRVVALIDWSTSARHASEVAVTDFSDELLASMTPGSTGLIVDFRLITANSWDPAAALGRVEIPAIDDAPGSLGACPNPVDPPLCERLADEHEAKVEANLRDVAAAKDSVAAQLQVVLDITMQPTDGTDIEGAFKVAETALGMQPGGAASAGQSAIVALTDLRHCLAGDCELRAMAPVNLAGVAVVIAGFGDADSVDGADADDVRDAFTWFVASCGGRSAFVLPHQTILDTMWALMPGNEEVD
jgi:hypothetical protein